MRNKVLLFVATAIVLMLLAACAGAPDSGKVTDKNFTDEVEWTERVCAKYQKKKTGTSTTKQVCVKWKNVERETDEIYELHLDDGEDSGWVSVSEEDYNEYAVGDQYP